jgi:phenylpyruvate tautomerase PptA (4-oxalocrotonate tautomerase family)
MTVEDVTRRRVDSPRLVTGEGASAGRVTDAVTTLNTDESSVSVAIEDVRPEDWAERVYKPDIAGNWERLYKKPGYNPSER